MTDERWPWWVLNHRTWCALWSGEAFCKCDRLDVAELVDAWALERPALLRAAV